MTDYFDVYTKRPRTPGDARWFELMYSDRWRAFEGRLFLDVGAGAGYLERTAPATARVIALDVDAAALRARRDGDPAPLRVQAEATALPFRAGVFDGVHCAHIIEHLWEPEALIREVRRVLRDRGTVMILTPDVVRYGFRFYVDHTHRRPFTKEGLRGLLAMHGFEDIRFEYGLLHTTRVELALRVLGATPDRLYPLKKRLGQRWSGELICVARKGAQG